MPLLIGFALFTIIIAPILYWGIKHEQERSRMLGVKPNHTVEIGFIAVILAIWLFIIFTWLGTYYASTPHGT